MILANNFTPFFGVIEEINDPEQLGRYQVRVYGFHTEKKSLIPTESLHWFPGIVNNSAGVSGKGTSPTEYVKGSMVFGYFIEESLQDGIIIGSFTGKPTSFAIRDAGFNDPDGIFPQYINESDVNRLARGDSQHWLFGVRSSGRFESIQKPLRQSVFNELPYANQAIYPFNTVHESFAGHVKEIDSTAGSERLNEHHPSGTYDETDKSGNRTIKIVGDGYELIAGDKFAYIRGDLNLTVEGNLNQYIKGNWNLQVDGNKTEVIQGNVKEFYAQGQTTLSNGGIAIDGSTINLNSGDASENGSIPITLAREYDVQFARPVLTVAGRFAALDEPGEIDSTPEEYPEDVKPQSFDGEVKEESDAEEEEKEVMVAGCNTIIEEGSIDYRKTLGSTDFTIGRLSNSALFPHSIRAQVGLSEQEIVCNLEALALNILQPLKDEFGDFRINSGFRVGSGRSQHNRGQACDIQEPSWSFQKHLEVADWMAKNLPVDSIIIEHGRGIWLHVSFNKDLSVQRGKLLTMLAGNYEPGLKLYF